MSHSHSLSLSQTLTHQSHFFYMIELSLASIMLISFGALWNEGPIDTVGRRTEWSTFDNTRGLTWIDPVLMPTDNGKKSGIEKSEIEPTQS